MSASLEVPHTQNTAPVLEYRCLYSADIRKKVKKWHDGRLKFHTFNKKVVVYDDRSNLVGDTHWKEDSDIQEDDEFELERGGILVQVQDFLEKRDQDLTELIDKRVKEKEGRAAARLAASPAAGRSQAFGAATPHLQPKPLNALLTPSGHYGRAIISNTSPFEDRQRQINGNENENEKERPAKRRKAVESSQSKNGYAQNLTGASLSFTSSKPPGTATIQYERLRSNPSKPPSKTIDLTLDDDEDTERGQSVQIDRRERPSIKEKSKRRRSPPPKSTYAGNLTGVALTLSRPEYRPSKRVNDVPVPNTKSKHGNHDVDLSTDDEDSFLDIDPSAAKQPVSVPKSNDLPPKKATKAAKAKPLHTSESSSSPPVERASKPKALPKTKQTTRPRSRSSSPVLEQVSKRQKVVDSAARLGKTVNSRSSSDIDSSRISGDQPVSALKIKSRAPRKMMMLMERPSSRSSLQNESSKATPRVTQKRVEASNEVVLSQATVQLNSFCQRQEESLKARLNGRRPLPTLDPADFDSSPEESINHQKIDELLSRRPMAIEPKVATALGPKIVPMVTSNSFGAEVTKDSVSEDQRCGPGESNKDKRKSLDLDEYGSPSDDDLLQDLIIPVGETTESIPPELPSQIIATAEVAKETRRKSLDRDGDGSPLDNDLLKGLQIPVDDAAPSIPLELPLHTIANTEIAQETETPKIVHSENNNVSSTTRIQPRLAEDSSNSMTTDPIPALVLSENNGAIPRISPKNKTRLHKLPKDLTGALESTINHFRTIVKSSPTSATRFEVNKVPTLPESTVSGSVDEPSDESSVQHPGPKPEALANELELPQSPPIEEPLQRENEPRITAGFGFRSAQNLHVASEVPNNPAALVSTGIDPPRAKLVNPATRGKSLQKTVAEADDAMAQAKRAMPPPALPPSRLASRAVAQPAVPRNYAPVPMIRQQSTEGMPLTGPWSREAYDLFGNWRPPGRAEPMPG